MNRLEWYFKRLQLMSPMEVICFRIPQLLQTKILGKFQAFKSLTLLNVNKNFDNPTYSITDLKILFDSHPFTTSFPVFTERVDLLSITDWRKDIATGITSPIAYYGNINRQDFTINGDVKFVSELSRMEFLPFMAFYYIYKEDTCRLDEIKKLIVTWNKQNPYLYTIHWTSGIEVAIRSVNLVYTHIILRQFDKLSQEINDEILQQLTYNYYFLRNHLSLYSSANNHLMAELMGLNVIASYLNIPEKEADKWKILFVDQVTKQVLSDGIHMERSTHYHSEVCDQILITLQFLNGANRDVSNEVEFKLKSMFQFLQHSIYSHGKTIFSDNDEGSVIWPYFQKDFCLYSSQLATANYLWKTNYSSSDERDFRNYLIFGEKFKTRKNLFQVKDWFYREAGYGFWYDSSERMKFSFDVGPIGDDLLAAHGHSDIFHFILEINGLAFIIDSGTYQYHSRHIFWRDYFRGATAHNTVTVNQMNHAISNGRMSWIKRPKVWLDAYEVSDNKLVCSAKTNAYVSQGVVMQKRTFVLDKRIKEISIVDELYGNDEDNLSVDFYLHFHPSVEVHHENQNVFAIHDSTVLKIENDKFTTAELISGNQEIPLGWYSPSFGVKKMCTSLRLTVKVNNHLKLLTKFNYSS